jgi:sugar phosphate isomerase/epimerase
MTAVEPGSSPLFLWAACVSGHPLLARAEGLHAGEFVAMSVLCEDFSQLARYPGWSPARVGAELRAREARAAVIDPYLGWYPDYDPAGATGQYAGAINASESDVLRYADAVGAESISVLAPFTGRPAPQPQVVDALGRFGAVAGSHGLRLHLEVIPTSLVPDVSLGWELVEEVALDNVGLVLDTFHLGRGGCDPAFLDRIPLEKVFHLQLCDAPREPQCEDYFEEAVTARQFAGEGELGVKAFVRHVIRDGSYPQMGPEVFSELLRGLPPAEAGRLCALKTRDFLNAVGD